MYQEAMRLLDHTPNYTLTTILLGQVTSYQQGEDMAKAAIARMAAVGVEGVGSFEIGNRKDSPAFEAFNAVFPVNDNGDEGIAHLHFVAKQRYNIISKLFPIKSQVHQEQMGIGKHISNPYETNVIKAINYCRKKKDAYNAWWFSQVSKEQLVYRMLNGVVSVLSGVIWNILNVMRVRGEESVCNSGWDSSGNSGGVECINGIKLLRGSCRTVSLDGHTPNIRTENPRSNLRRQLTLHTARVRRENPEREPGETVRVIKEDIVTGILTIETTEAKRNAEIRETLRKLKERRRAA